MASLRVLAFDHEGRPIQFDKWLDDLQLYLLSDSKDSVSLFDLVSSAATAPPATADSSTRSQWLTLEDLVSHLRASDTRYRAAVPAEFLDRNPPPMYITLYFLVTCLPDSLPSVRDHFLSLDPTSLTVDLLEQHLLVAETSAVAVGAARGTPRPPFFEGCSPSPLAPSYASAAAADVSVPEDVEAASVSAKRRSSKGKGGRGGGGGSGGGGGESRSGSGGSSGGGGNGGTVGGSGGSGGGGGGSGGSGGNGGGGTGARRIKFAGGQRQQQQRRSETPCPYVIRTGDRAGQTCGRLHTQHSCFSRLDDAWRAEFGDDVELPRWENLLKSRIAIFDLDFDAILSAMYALFVSAEGDCYRCVPPDPGIAAAPLGASESGTLLGTAPAAALHTFTLDSGASPCFFRDSTTLTPLPTPVLVRLADPSRGPVVACSSTILLMVTTTTPGGQRVSICTCTRTGRHLATFTRRPGSSLYTLTTEPSQVAASAQVSASGQVAASCSCRLLSHHTLLWHHRLGHPSLPRLHGMHSCLLVSGLPRSLPPLPPSPALPCLPCVKRRQRAAPHSSSFPPTTTPLQTLHMDVWGPARVSGQSRERYFLLVVDDYTRYTTVFPLRSKGQDHPVLRLHSDRGGEFSSNHLWEFCRGEGILQSFTLPEFPQHNGIAERRTGLVMEVARTSMIHAAAPHFLWPFAVRYATHQLNLWPRVSLLETSPTLRWTGEVGDASVFRVWGSRAFVRDTSADKLSPRAIPCVFLGFVPDAPGWQFYHPTSRRVFPSPDVTFDKSVLFYRLFPYCSAPPPPPLLFLAPGPPPVDPLPPQGPAPSGVSHVDLLPGPAPVQVAVDSGAARGAPSGGAEPRDAESEGAETGGAEPGGVATGGGEPGDGEPEGVEPGGAASEGAESGGAEPQGAASSGGSLNGIILEELYMQQPEGLDDGSGRVCRLKKAIYGLKQAPRAWYHKLEETLLAGGFKKSECDHSLFLLQEKEQFLMLLVYVDDILLFSKSSAMIEHVEEMLEMQFKCSKMGDVKYSLGMHVERDLDKGVLRLHQRKAKTSWAAAAVPDLASGGSSRADPRLCHTCGEHGHLKRDCPNVPTFEVRQLQRRLEQLPNPTEVKAQALLAYEEVDEGEEEGERDYTREYAVMAYSWAGEDIRLRPRAEQSQSSEASSGTRPWSSQGEGARPSEMRRHPNERLVCQASVLIAEKGSLTVGGLPVRQAIIDTRAHHVLIGKGLTNQPKLDVSGRTIERGILLMTTEGGEPKWMPKTRRPVEVVLLPGTEKECCIQLQCNVSELEDYDVLVGMELLYQVGATICTWQEKVLFRVQYWDPESSVGTLPVRFVRQEPREAYQAQRKDLTEELEDWPWEKYEEEYERRIERRTLGQGPPDLKERVSRVQALDVPICILELYGGIGTGLAAALRAGSQVGSRAHRPRRYWQNMMSTAALRHSLALMQRPEPRLVSDILEPNRLPAPVTCPDHPSQYQCNEPGKPRQALPTLVSYADARGFRMEGELPGPGMIYDVRKGVWEQPTANKREAAMGHLWGVTAHPEVTEQ
ncbi:unnamed protein product [Closterium sp. NIES-54]